jgi:hypothetical protein
VKSWTVPIANGHDFELVVDGPSVVVQRAVVREDGVRLGTINVDDITSVESCQLGQALLDASREAGAIRAKGRKR